MNNIKNIVVGLDITKNTTDILKRAFSIAKYDNSTITLVHAIDNGILQNFVSDIDIEKIKKDATSKIEEYIDIVGTLNIQYSILVNEKKPSNFIVNTAKNLNADLIIIGENSEENFESKVFGSTAHNVAQKSNIPLLVIKNAYHHDYDNMVAFSDFSKISLDSLKFANTLFKNNDIKMISIYKQVTEIMLRYKNIYDRKEDIESKIRESNEDEFQKFIKENNINNAQLIEEFHHPKSVLLNYVKTNKNDLVILGSKGINNAHSLLYGSTASFLMENLDSDILIYVP